MRARSVCGLLALLSILAVVGAEPGSTTDAPISWAYLAAGGTRSFGAKGEYDPASQPGPLGQHRAVFDKNGILYVFFGGVTANEASSLTNTVWAYDPKTELWKWVAGSTTLNTPGSASEPGARRTAGVAYDGTKFWVYGGHGFMAVEGVTQPVGALNDLWSLDPSTGEWTFHGGATGVDATPVGLGGGVTIWPGGKSDPLFVSDSQGKLWCGFGVTASATMNDFYMYDPATGEWTWRSGDDAPPGRPAGDAELGVESDAVPGGRSRFAYTIDKDNNIWIYSGTARLKSTSGRVNELWRYSIPRGKWTWMHGSNLPFPLWNSVHSDEDNIAAVGASYGTLGVADPSNTPGAREYGSLAADSTGTLWYGFGKFGGTTSANSDIWTFRVGEGWIWQGGSNRPGHVGTNEAPGEASVGNAISSRWRTDIAIDQDNNLFVIGGYGARLTDGGNAMLSDLWRMGGYGECADDATKVDPTSTSCPGGSEGDPHVVGFRGQKFDFMGDPGKVFAWYSDIDVAINFKLERNPANDMVYQTAMGVRFGKDVMVTLTIHPHYELGFEPHDPKGQTLGNCGRWFWTENTKTLVIQWHGYTLTIDRRKLVEDVNGFRHLDFAMNGYVRTSKGYVHGVLGQTHRPSQPVPGTLQGEGVMEAPVEQYIVRDGLLGTKWAFNRFNGTAGAYTAKQCEALMKSPRTVPHLLGWSSGGSAMH